ncbi:uncharacterized protein Z518_05866 [Rhinocladiella mackenziei CBS 650.93]|uniref:SUZ-C domain-containing protein n=1 Tax=Rhinocladiella mackenziei CBS 650.93 TaxID=1442369 RepID=A0A0D2IGW8_9EURO|nr:uncharacterized protein Z518_05866 [Rhinocladiella mackenziei CBS 650.93]KIX04994.1 hypothetical protein Z518_05866 [Rhinocladiella mackenziei CBS 650.93]
MSKIPDAWEDEWSSVADKQPTPPNESGEPKKVSSRVTKAQRRAQQAEFNRQLWAEAEGPKETNYFLESRNVVPLRSEFKPPPILLSRKGPIIQSPKLSTSGMQDLSLSNDNKNAESSEDEDEIKARELSLAERQAQAARDREEKQRKYEERRQELFGPPSNSNSSSQQANNYKSDTPSPASLTPPGSRSATPNRGRGKGGRRGAANTNNLNPRTPSRGSQHRELYDPSYVAKPDSVHVPRRENGSSNPRTPEIQPVRVPRGPDGSGRGGFGFAIPNPNPRPVRGDPESTENAPALTDDSST